MTTLNADHSAVVAAHVSCHYQPRHDTNKNAILTPVDVMINKRGYQRPLSWWQVWRQSEQKCFLDGTNQKYLDKNQIRTMIISLPSSPRLADSQSQWQHQENLSFPSCWEGGERWKVVFRFNFVRLSIKCQNIENYSHSLHNRHKMLLMYQQIPTRNVRESCWRQWLYVGQWHWLL